MIHLNCKLTEDQELNIVELYLSGVQSLVLAKKFDVCTGTIQKIMKRRGHKLRGRGSSLIHQVNEDFFKTIDSHVKAQILGFILADGSVCDKGGYYSLRIEIQKRDEEILHQIAQEMKFSGKLYTRKIKDSFYSKLHIGRKTIVADLINLGCHPNKTFNLSFPFQTVDREFWNSIIYGYWLGDGWSCIGKPRNGKNFRPFYLGFVSNNVFIDNISSIFYEILNIKPVCTNPHWRTKGVSDLRISNKDGFISVADWMLKDKILDIPRKTAKLYETLDCLKSKD